MLREPHSSCLWCQTCFLQGKQPQDRTKIEVAPEIYKALAEAESARKNNGKAASTSEPDFVSQAAAPVTLHATAQQPATNLHIDTCPVLLQQQDLKSLLDTAKKLGETVQAPDKEASMTLLVLVKRFGLRCHTSYCW